ncbi:MAG: DUF4442 domain-containing protein [Propionibacterium sp.]|nr:DUF4442 domain-containing protein [Propionibacterium sp.]
MARLPRTYADLQQILGSTTLTRWAMNGWPPFLASSIRVREISPDWRRVRVQLLRRRVTANYVGTLYGGSLYSMTDPFWMMMVRHNLPRGWTVWDKAGEIDYISPGRATVGTTFELTEEDLAEIHRQIEATGKALHWFANDIVTADGTPVARVRKQIHVRPPRE